MKFYKQVISFAVALLVAPERQVEAAGYDKAWDYLYNGADWPLDKDSQCSDTNQSPIDLRTDFHTDPFPEADGNEFKGSYGNLVKASSLNMGKVIQVNMPDAKANYFESQHSVDVLKGVKKYSAAQFHFHAKSEHTINGRRYDMEMHTVHLAEDGSSRRLAEASENKGPWASAVGIMFDRVHYDQSLTKEEQQKVDNFFEALDFSSSSSETNSDQHTILAKDVDIPYGDLTKLVNFANRWAYNGSLTTPPCTTGVYFQVVDRVLPISEKHFNAYLALQAKHNSKDYFDKDGKLKVASVLDTNPGATTVPPIQRKLNTLGNYRITNKIDNHNVRYMRAQLKTDEKADPTETTTVLTVILVISVVFAVGLSFWACAILRKENMAEKQREAMKEGGAADYKPRIEMSSSIN